MKEMSTVRRYIQLILLVLAAGTVYPIVYLRTYYQDAMVSALHITTVELNNIYVVLGIVFIVGYIPSGLLADKFSSKRLIVFSCTLTALGGVWFSFLPGYGSVLVIYAIWGIATVFTFWSALLKLVKLLANAGEEGRFFGILDGGRGVSEAILASIGAIIVAGILGGLDATKNVDLARDAMSRIIWMYTIVVAVFGVLVGIFVEPDKKIVAARGGAVANSDVDDKFHFRDVSKVLANPAIWIMGIVIFMSYVVTWTYYYYSSFLTSEFPGHAAIALTATAATVMVVGAWMRPVGGIVGGFLADKLGRNVTLMGALVLSAVTLVALPLWPKDAPPAVFFVLVVLASLFTWTIRGVYWSLLGDAGIAPKISGTGVGVVSFIGYWGDILVPILVTSLIAATGGTDTGYFTPFFIVGAVAAIVAAVFVFVFQRVTVARGTALAVRTAAPEPELAEAAVK